MAAKKPTFIRQFQIISQTNINMRDYAKVNVMDKKLCMVKYYKNGIDWNGKIVSKDYLLYE
jgi:hypothetical protein